MVMIDDATNRTYARFSEQETTRAAFDTFEGYVRRYGMPRGLYVDRDSIYRTDREPTVREQLAGKESLTQFGRAMKQLGVELDLANSPQAKGRVERRNGVFQDRLVKELRLAGISDLAEANRFLEEQFCPSSTGVSGSSPRKRPTCIRDCPRTWRRPFAGKRIGWCNGTGRWPGTAGGFKLHAITKGCAWPAKGCWCVRCGMARYSCGRELRSWSGVNCLGDRYPPPQPGRRRPRPSSPNRPPVTLGGNGEAVPASNSGAESKPPGVPRARHPGPSGRRPFCLWRAGGVSY